MSWVQQAVDQFEPARSSVLYARMMTIAELSEEMGVDVGDVAVMIMALSGQVDHELWKQAADLRDVLEAKLRARHVGLGPPTSLTQFLRLVSPRHAVMWSSCTVCFASAPLPLGAPSKQIGSSMSNDDDEQAGTVDPYLDDLYDKIADALRRK
jgi:hypothetical protein